MKCSLPLALSMCWHECLWNILWNFLDMIECLCVVVDTKFCTLSWGMTLKQPRMTWKQPPSVGLALWGWISREGQLPYNHDASKLKLWGKRERDCIELKYWKRKEVMHQIEIMVTTSTYECTKNKWNNQIY